VILNNTFSFNGAYIDGGAIFVRARGLSSSGLYSSTAPSNANYHCGGYLFQGNTFEYTISCPKRAGATLHFECVGNTDTPNTPANDRYTSALNTDIPGGLQDLFKTASATTWVDDTHLITYESSVYTIYKNKLLFKGNTYRQNAASGGHSIVEVINAYRTFFEDDTYT